MLEKLAGLFRSSYHLPTAEGCRGCMALDRLIEEMREQVRDLRTQRDRLHDDLEKALHLAPAENRSPAEPSVRRPSTNNWGQIKRALEEKHRKPEDQVHEYWTKRANEMQVGIPEIEEQLLKDASELG